MPLFGDASIGTVFSVFLVIWLVGFIVRMTIIRTARAVGKVVEHPVGRRVAETGLNWLIGGVFRR